MKPKRFDQSVNFKLPEVLAEAVTQVADRRMTSTSAYCREALLEKLERDGICLVFRKKAAAA
jgi:hypothetical protein